MTTSDFSNLNVRKLEHMIERSVLLSDTKTLTKVYLPDPIVHDQHGATDVVDLEGVEKQHIIEILRRCWDKIKKPANSKVAGFKGFFNKIRSTSLVSGGR